MDIGPLWLLDKDYLSYRNTRRHPLSREDVGKSKAYALARHLRREFPACKAEGIKADFRALPPDDQLNLVRSAEVVVAATDEHECQLRINEVCFRAEVTAVYPGIWVRAGTRPAEVGEILWVLSSRNSPCYECAISTRPMATSTHAWRGNRADVELLAIVTAQLTAALLEQGDDTSEILDTKRTMVLVHGFTPTSKDIRDVFYSEGLRNINVEVAFDDQCRVCGKGPGPVTGKRRESVSSGQARSVREPRNFPDHGWNASVDGATSEIRKLSLWLDGYLETFPGSGD